MKNICTTICILCLLPACAFAQPLRPNKNFLSNPKHKPGAGLASQLVPVTTPPAPLKVAAAESIPVVPEPTRAQIKIDVPQIRVPALPTLPTVSTIPTTPELVSATLNIDRAVARNWLQSQQQHFYTPKDRAEMQRLLTGPQASIRINAPDMYQIEGYLAKQAGEEMGNYLAPAYRKLILKQNAANPKVTALAAGMALSPNERRPDPRLSNYVTSMMLNIIKDTEKLIRFLPEDPYLNAVHEFYVGAYRIFYPLEGSAIGKMKLDRPDGRTFDFQEFFLFDRKTGQDYILNGDQALEDIYEDEVELSNTLLNNALAEKDALLSQVPENLHIAVLNDDQKPLNNFLLWAHQGYLGKNATVEIFSDGNDLLNAMRSNHSFDVIVTDIFVRNGGRAMMPQLRELDSNVTVFAMSKDSRENVDAISLFENGIDGYMVHTSTLNDSEVGWHEWLRGYVNYLDLKKLRNWSR